MGVRVGDRVGDADGALLGAPVEGSGGYGTPRKSIAFAIARYMVPSSPPSLASSCEHITENGGEKSGQ